MYSALGMEKKLSLILLPFWAQREIKFQKYFLLPCALELNGKIKYGK